MVEGRLGVGGTSIYSWIHVDCQRYGFSPGKLAVLSSESHDMIQGLWEWNTRS
jgi:hypothetical protein